MNYLGHLVLSGCDEKILLGNFLGDHISNKMLHLYDSSIQKGIKLHREIDIFTDSHPISRELRAIIFDKYRHRSRVILDLFYDHFLAVNFHNFHNISLDDYVIKVSKILLKQVHLMPQSAKDYFIAMQKYSWLESYSSIDGIRLALNQMSRRRNMNLMGSSVDILERQYSFFREKTHVFLHESIEQFLENK